MINRKFEGTKRFVHRFSFISSARSISSLILKGFAFRDDACILFSVHQDVDIADLRLLTDQMIKILDDIRK